MTRTYMVVFERGKEAWGAWAPDVPNTGGLGNSIPETRNSLAEGIRQALEFLVETGQPIPEAKTTHIDFSEFEKDAADPHYEIEWLTVEVPVLQSTNEPTTAKAA